MFNLVSNKLLWKKTGNSAPVFSLNPWYPPVMWLFLPEVAGIGDQHVPGYQPGSCQLAMTFNHCQAGSGLEPVTWEESLCNPLTNSSLSPSLPRWTPCPIKLHCCHWICQHAHRSLKGEINLNYRVGQTCSKVHSSEILVEANISDRDPFKTMASVSLLEHGQGWEIYTVRPVKPYCFYS